MMESGVVWRALSPRLMKIVRSKQCWRVLGFGRVLDECLESLALRQGYRVGAVCRALGMSEAYLREVFLRDVGLSPKDWMQRERMVVARRMLLCGRDPLEVSEALGFSHPNSFRREFTSVYGVGPVRFVEERKLDHG